ncbi:MAG: cupin domain-containing protein [Euryarchaeota archaeon]|nr:cupin domain-containing protein [Euryarchaeota archaeon]
MIKIEEMSEGPLVKDLKALAEFAQDAIVSKVFLDRPAVNMTLFCMSRGQSLSEHTASKPAAIHVLQGRGVIHLGEEKYDATAGTWVYMPKDQRHAIDAAEDMVFLLTLFKQG